MRHFKGVIDENGVFTPYTSIDAYHTAWQMKRGIYGTNDQQRLWSWVPMMLTLYGNQITRKHTLRLAA